MAKPDNVLVFESPEFLARGVAERIAGYVRALPESPERFSLVLAGGNTPRRVYESLASEAYRGRVDWDRVDIFFGDERCVPPDHADSNYGMAYETLISRVPIPPAQVYRMLGEDEPVHSARLYESQLRTYFAGASWPQFSLVLLGIGTDGHTASLFPDSDALKEVERWVVPTKSPLPPQQRLTLTLPVLNHSKHVLFLVSGAEKSERLAQLLKPQHPDDPLPAQLIQPAAGSVEWFVDRAAAARFSKQKPDC